MSAQFFLLWAGIVAVLFAWAGGCRLLIDGVLSLVSSLRQTPPADLIEPSEYKTRPFIYPMDRDRIEYRRLSAVCELSKVSPARIHEHMKSIVTPMPPKVNR